MLPIDSFRQGMNSLMRVCSRVTRNEPGSVFYAAGGGVRAEASSVDTRPPEVVRNKIKGFMVRRSESVEWCGKRVGQNGEGVGGGRMN